MLPSVYCHRPAHHRFLHPFPTRRSSDLNAFAVEQALRNLVENAIKYSARGSVITIDLSQHEGEFQLSVIDRGRGVPQEVRELIFERFRRADRRGSGSGLGLSIVRRVAEAHGGHVSVEDAPEGGGAFILLFPQSYRKTLFSKS